MPLSLKARVTLRDKWECEASDVQKAICAVEETVGWPVRCNPDFDILWEELQNVYEDVGEFVAAITALVRIWCQELDSLLSDAHNEVLAENFLETVRKTGNQSISLRIDIGEPAAAKTSWNPPSGTFTLAVPSTRVTFAPDHAAELRAQIVAVFEKGEAPSQEDWADLGEPTLASPVAAKGAAFLPTLADVPRPEILQLQPPYRLIVHDRNNCIEVQCTHSPSLELLAAYLEKWCRASPSRSDRRPIMNVCLNKSAFGLGLIYDALTVAPNDSHESTLLPPVLVLNLVENVLGYTLMQEYAQSWRFIRNEAIRVKS